MVRVTEEQVLRELMARVRSSESEIPEAELDKGVTSREVAAAMDLSKEHAARLLGDAVREGRVVATLSIDFNIVGRRFQTVRYRPAE